MGNIISRIERFFEEEEVTTTNAMSCPCVSKAHAPYLLTQKANPYNDKGVGMPVIMETNNDGSIDVHMPHGAPPDSIGFNMNRAFQKQRVSKAVARLRAKHAAKYAH